MKKGPIALMLFLGACQSTESINRFAKSATAGSSEIGQSVISFYDLCRLADPSALEHFTDTSLYGHADYPPVHCLEYKQADSLTGLISQTLVNYFSLLQAVSDKKLIAYNARDLVNALSGLQPQLYPSLVVTDEKITAVKGLLNTILNEPMKYYRQKKLVSTMRFSDSALIRVLTAYTFILDTALTGEINQAKANYTSFVYATTFEWARTPVEKLMINQQYNSFLLSMEKEKEKIKKSVRLLKIIAKDHHLLAYGPTPAGFADTEAAISQDILLINKIITELIQLLK